MVSIGKGPQERRRGTKGRNEEKSATQEENHNITPVVQLRCCLFQGKVFKRTISKHMSDSIATVTMSARAESVGVSPILAKTTLGGQT